MATISKLIPQESNEWDRYVQQHPSRSPYHLSGWVLAVEKAYHHKNISLIARDQSGQVCGILPLVLFSIPLKGSHLCSLPYCDVGGVLADNREVEAQLTEHALHLLKEHRCNQLNLRSFSETEPQDDYKGKVRMLMDLPGDSETLLSSFKSKLRSQIRKAEKNGLDTEVVHNSSAIDYFYDVFSQNMKNLGSPVHAKSWFNELSETYGNDMKTFLVKKDDLVVGAAIVLVCGDKASIPWASTLSEFNRLAPNMLLYWSVLEYLSDNDVKQFDFGRSSYGEGTYKFKKQWGASPIPLTWRDIDKLGRSSGQEESVSTTGQLRQKVEAIWRKLPLSLTQWLGPRIRKYVSL